MVIQNGNQMYISCLQRAPAQCHPACREDNVHQQLGYEHFTQVTA